jgi:3-hydroxyisobutyrate dehydrogenase-like beta-hydroxyacid dehydrogenase/NAD(P)-dependent dehydrogenase (short-subunit alcohol dehydrogenase family)
MKVGFIGLGIMGAAMAANLQKAGFALVVNDIRREAASRHLAAGAEWAETAREVAATTDVVFSCLPNLHAIETVALGEDGIIAGIAPGGAFFEMSTNSPDLVRRLHAAFAARGSAMLDAPVSGGAGGAVLGRLAMWVGGERAAFDRFKPVLDAMADRAVHVGAVGAGLVTKLVHNCASQTMQAALAEVFVLGVKGGAEPLALWEAIRQGSIGRRRTFDGLVDEYLPAHYEPPNAALRIIHKDMTLATALGRELGVPMPLANIALADIVEAMNRGWAERDARSVMLLPQQRSGVEVTVDPARIAEVLARDPPAPTDSKRGAGTTPAQVSARHDRVAGKVAIVTGAGSVAEGIGNGRAAAILLARNGARVALLDRDRAAAEATAAMIAAEGGTCRVIETDVTDEASCAAAVRETVSAWGRLDILVNNVGLSRVRGTAETIDLAEWDRGMRVNVLSIVLMSRFAVPEMRRSGGGSIINIGSITGLHGGHPNLLYPTAKGAIINLTRTLAGHHGGDGIRVNCIAPGFVYTPTVYSRGLPDGVREARQDSSVLKTEGTGWDVGYGVLYLASDEARWVTGIVLPIDAGVSAISPHFTTSARRLS